MPPPHLLNPILLLLTTLPLTYGCQRDWSALHKRAHYTHLPTARLTKRSTNTSFPPALTDHESLLLNAFEEDALRTWSHYYTHGNHLGSYNKSQAEWTRDRWTENGLDDAWLEEFPIYVTYPERSRLWLTVEGKNGTGNGSTHEANLVEDVLEEDDTSGYPDLIPAYHAMSASGSVRGEYVYVGRGTRADFQVLKDAGIDLKGKIALANYGAIYRGTKVKNAQDNGMIGCVIYTDPLDDGDITEENGYAAYPHGPARNPSSIQRGSVRFSSLYSGDPTTVGYASSPDSPRNSIEPYTPSIPSIPLSMKDGLALLHALQGHGVSAAQANRSGWAGGFANVSYDSGPAPGAVVHIDHLMKGWIAPVWDVLGVVNGTSPDEVVILGNHRDAWIIGGAADPNSGSAVLVEFAKALGKLKESGWRPRRTIILASWDAEEFGLQGSTEWVESHLPWLTATTVAYVNLDVAVSGPRTMFAGSGELQPFVIEQMKKVVFPESWDGRWGSEIKTIYDMWFNTTEGEVSPLGSGSDYASFWQNGIAAIDIGSDNHSPDPVWHYHSQYDSHAWMLRYGDPHFGLHVAMGQFISLIVYHLSTAQLLPYDIPHAATVLQSYLAELEDTVAESDFPDLDLSPLESAIQFFSEQADKIDKAAKQAVAFNDTVLIDVVNSKYRDFSRGFASAGGLPGRETFRNVLSAPGIDNGYGADVFPGVTDSLGAGKREQAEEWIEKSGRAVRRAAEILGI